MADKTLFRLAMPHVTLPAGLGGKRAVVMFSIASKQDMTVQFCTCIDIDGGLHQNVPIPVFEVRAGTLRPIKFLEVEDVEAPLITPVSR